MSIPYKFVVEIPEEFSYNNRRKLYFLLYHELLSSFVTNCSTADMKCDLKN